MKKFTVLAAVLLAFSITIQAEDRNKYDRTLEMTRPMTDAIGGELHSFSEAFTRHILKGTRFEQAEKNHQLNRDKKTLRAMRSVKDCIKPGGLIDDEVQMCVNGTREKNW